MQQHTSTLTVGKSWPMHNGAYVGWIRSGRGRLSESCGKANARHTKSNAKETVPLIMRMGKAALLGAFSARSLRFSHVFQATALSRA